MTNPLLKEVVEAAEAVLNELESDGNGGYYLALRVYFDPKAAYERLNAAVAAAKATS